MAWEGRLTGTNTQSCPSEHEAQKDFLVQTDTEREQFSSSSEVMVP